MKAAAQKAIDNTKSIGFAFTSCTVPAKGTPTFSLEEDEMEYGVGIHGEPGIRRERIVSADELAQRMVTSLLEQLEVRSGAEEEVAVLINGFGATPMQELYLLNHSVVRELASRQHKVFKAFVGNYMTSIDMAGASVSIMKLDQQLKQLLNADCDTPALVVHGAFDQVNYTEVVVTPEENNAVSYTCETSEEHAVIVNDHISLNNMIYLVDKMSEVIIKNEVPFCELDSHAGDGDFGMSVAKGFKQLKAEWNELITFHTKDIGSFLDACSLIIMEHCGGASGPIWGSGFRAASKYARNKQELSINDLAEMMAAVVKGIQDTGERAFGRGAVVGDKTLIDALAPYADSWADSSAQGDDLKTASAKAAEAAHLGAKQTEAIVARMGRAGAVGERSIGYPDAGAYALGVIFTELAQSIK
ncbi:PTS-dependent dihydroxyacetone kinase, dihydroxyacetone-binding subunit DhaK [compost metagenome]